MPKGSPITLRIACMALLLLRHETSTFPKPLDADRPLNFFEKYIVIYLSWRKWVEDMKTFLPLFWVLAKLMAPNLLSWTYCGAPKNLKKTGLQLHPCRAWRQPGLHHNMAWCLRQGLHTDHGWLSSSAIAPCPPEHRIRMHIETPLNWRWRIWSGELFRWK